MNISSAKIVTADEFEILIRKNSKIPIHSENYIVRFDEPDKNGFFGNKLRESFFSLNGTKNDHSLVEEKFMKMHPEAVNVRIDYV